jgi:hypothetical protein
MGREGFAFAGTVTRAAREALGVAGSILAVPVGRTTVRVHSRAGS